MSEIPPESSTSPPQPSPQPPSPRLRLLLIVGGAVLVMLIIGVVVLVTVLGAHRGSTQTVNALIQSIETGDCDLYIEVTTEFFRGTTISAGDCETSGAFEGTGTIDYDLDILSSQVTGTTATVSATLTIVDTSAPDAQPIVTPITFDLVQVSGAWKVDGSY